MEEETEKIEISLTVEQVHLYGLTLNNAIVFLLNHKAPPSFAKNLEELKGILQAALIAHTSP